MEYDNSILKDNINALIDASGLTDGSFANMMGFSLRKLKYIRKGEATLKLGEHKKVCDFFLVKDLIKKSITVDVNLRAKLLTHHKGNEEYTKKLEESPSIVYAITKILLTEKDFPFPSEVAGIRAFFNKQGWHYQSSAISTALKRMPDIIEIKKHKSKGNTNVYLIKK